MLENLLRRTLLQVEAIKAGVQHGLTLVVGPPGAACPTLDCCTGSVCATHHVPQYLPNLPVQVRAPWSMDLVRLGPRPAAQMQVTSASGAPQCATCISA